MNVDSNAVEIAVGVFGIIATVVGFYNATNVRLRALEIEVENLKRGESKQDEKFNRIMEKLDTQDDKVMQKLEGQDKVLAQIRVDLQNKQDR